MVFSSGLKSIVFLSSHQFSVSWHQQFILWVWQHIGVIFHEKSIILITHRWVFFLHLYGLLLNFFQTTKGLRFYSYPISLPIFSFFPLAVHPVGMTTYWCYFCEQLFIILWNCNQMMCPYATFLCTKFQGNWIKCLHFLAPFTPWWTEEKQTTKKKTEEEIQLIFENSYLRNILWNVKWLCWVAFPL